MMMIHIDYTFNSILAQLSNIYMKSQIKFFECISINFTWTYLGYILYSDDGKQRKYFMKS